jgi:hypothetical protein
MKKLTSLTPDKIILNPRLYVVENNYKIWKQKTIIDVAMAALPKDALKAAQQNLKDLPEQTRAEYLAFIVRMEPVSLSH